MNIKHTFFSENSASGVLSDTESAHAIRVLRLKTGDFFYLLNGKGEKALCAITNTGAKKVSYTIEKTEDSKPTEPNITVAIALPKSKDRIQTFIEKVTEIGVTQIIPLITNNIERIPPKTDKLKNVAVAALKQSGNFFLPTINAPIKINTLIANLDLYDAIFIAHCELDNEKLALKEIYNGEKKVLILIGPEGDFTSEEVILAKENGFKSVSLGTNRLRTETAGIIACHTFHLLY